MKLIIDIPEELAKKQWYADKEIWKVVRAVWNGIPIPDNATNGDIVMAFFPNEHDFETDFDEDWWNAPYQKGGKE